MVAFIWNSNFARGWFLLLKSKHDNLKLYNNIIKKLSYDQQPSPTTTLTQNMVSE